MSFRAKKWPDAYIYAAICEDSVCNTDETAALPLQCQVFLRCQPAQTLRRIGTG